MGSPKNKPGIHVGEDGNENLEMYGKMGEISQLFAPNFLIPLDYHLVVSAPFPAHPTESASQLSVFYTKYFV